MIHSLWDLFFVPVGLERSVRVRGARGALPVADKATRASGRGLEPERCRWQMKRRRRVCRGRQMTQPFAARKLPGTTNGRHTMQPPAAKRAPGTATGVRCCGRENGSFDYGHSPFAQDDRGDIGGTVWSPSPTGVVRGWRAAGCRPYREEYGVSAGRCGHRPLQGWYGVGGTMWSSSPTFNCI